MRPTGLTISTKKTEVVQMRRVPLEGEDDAEELPEPLPAGYHRTPAGHLYVRLPEPEGTRYRCPFAGCAAGEKLYSRDALSGHVNIGHSLKGRRPSLLNSEPRLVSIPDISAAPNGWDYSCNICGKTYTSGVSSLKAKSNAQEHCHKTGHCQAEKQWVDTKGKPLEHGHSQKEAHRRRVLQERTEAGFDVEDEPEFVTLRDATGQRVPLKNVTQFKYLVRMVYSDGSDDGGMTARITLANATAHALFKNASRMSRRTKLRIFGAIVKARVVYAAETWVLTDVMRRRLDTFYLRWMRVLTGVRTTKVNGCVRYPRTATVLQAAGTALLSDQVDVQRLRFWGHSLRRPDAISYERFPVAGKQGFATATYALTEQLNALMEEAGLQEGDAQDRVRWREGVSRLKAARKRAAVAHNEPAAR